MEADCATELECGDQLALLPRYSGILFFSQRLGLFSSSLAVLCPSLSQSLLTNTRQKSKAAGPEYISVVVWMKIKRMGPLPRACSIKSIKPSPGVPRRSRSGLGGRRSRPCPSTTDMCPRTSYIGCHRYPCPAPLVTPLGRSGQWSMATRAEYCVASTLISQ